MEYCLLGLLCASISALCTSVLLAVRSTFKFAPCIDALLAVRSTVKFACIFLPPPPPPLSFPVICVSCPQGKTARAFEHELGISGPDEVVHR